MALNMMQAYKRRQEGGGNVGKIAGTVIGGAAGAYFGGPAGAVTGAGLGGSIGGTVGDTVVKPQASNGPQFQPTGGAMERRMGSSQPAYASQSPALEESLKSLNTLPAEQQEQYRQPLLKAYALSLRNDYRNGGLG